MGKAAERRKENLKSYLARLAVQDPKRFEVEWEKRLASWLPLWLADIRKEAKSWKEGAGYGKRIFDILDEAMFKTMEILQECPQSITEDLGSRVFNLISNECCIQVARILDSRLYRLSNINLLAEKARRSPRDYREG